MNLVALIEWTWTLQSLVGIAVCAWALVDSYADRAALAWAVRYAKAAHLPVPNHGGATVVLMNLRGARASMVLHAFFAVLGLTALLTPDQDFGPAIALYGSAYIVVAFVNLRAILLNQVDRVRVRREELSGSTITGTTAAATKESDMQAIVREDPPDPNPDPKPDDEGGGDGSSVR